MKSRGKGPPGPKAGRDARWGALLCVLLEGALLCVLLEALRTGPCVRSHLPGQVTSPCPCETRQDTACWEWKSAWAWGDGGERPPRTDARRYQRGPNHPRQSSRKLPGAASLRWMHMFTTTVPVRAGEVPMDGSPASGTGPPPPVPHHVAGVRSLSVLTHPSLRHRLLCSRPPPRGAWRTALCWRSRG